MLASAYVITVSHPRSTSQYDAMKCWILIEMPSISQCVVLDDLKKRSRSYASKFRYGNVLFIVILVLAIFPPVLVMLDRWFEVQWINTQFLSAWCYPVEYCRTVLPAYFVVILPGTVLLLLLFILRNDNINVFIPMQASLREENDPRPSKQRRQIGNFLISIAMIWIVWRIAKVWTRPTNPGWNYIGAYLLLLCGWLLRDISPTRFVDRWRDVRRDLGFMLFNHTTLIGFLACIYNSTNAWPFFLLLFVASLILHRKSLRKIPNGYWISSFALVLFTQGINRWWFSIIGDEYAFFRYAHNIVQQQNLANIGDHLFYGQGVYQTHPYLSSLIQAVFMKIFGPFNFGWRFSNIYLSAIAIGLFHSVFRSFFRARVADFAAIFLAFSQYLISFGKIGYNNLQAFFMLALVLYVTRQAIAGRRNIDFALLGTVCGLCFYVYPAALFIPPISCLLILVYRSPITRSTTRNLGVSLLCFFILLLPLFSQSSYWLNKIPGTFLYTPALSQSPSSIAYHLSSNLLSALYSFLYAPQETHFVAASYVDPLSAALSLIGLALLLSKYRSHKFVFFLMMSFVYLLFFLGATHDRSVPSTTRMFLMLPWFAVFSAMGFAWMLQRLQHMQLPRLLITVVTGLVLIGCLVLNLYQALPLAQKRMAYRYHSFQVMFLREAPQLLAEIGNEASKVIILNRPDTHLLESLYELLDIYRIPYNQTQLKEVDAESILQEDQGDELLSDRHSLIIITPWVYGEMRTSIERVLYQAGKQRYEITNYAGDTVYVVWETRPEQK